MAQADPLWKAEDQAERLAEQTGAGGKDELMGRAKQLIGHMTVAQAYQMTKAFATYFELTNLAETNHRKRRRRAAEVSPEHPAQPGSFLGTLRRLRAAG